MVIYIIYNISIPVLSSGVFKSLKGGRGRIVLGPYVQYCPREASEQKLGQKPKYELKEIELSYFHHSICLKKTSILKNNVKNG